MSEGRDEDEAGPGGDVSAPHPRMVTALFGHEAAERTLLQSYRSGRIPHGWLIGGPEGTGKATLAYRVARFVLAHPDPAAPAVQKATSLAVEASHPAARLVAAQGHPDLLVLERVPGDSGKLRSVITVDQVRRCVPFLGSTAGEGGWRVIVVDSLDEMNAEGENALLKLLEEPPARTLLLLVAHRPGRVRATIRSRCRRLMLERLGEADTLAAIAAATGRAQTDEELRHAAASAEGSVARAIALLDGDTLAFRQGILSLLARLPELDPRALHALGDAMGGSDPKRFASLIDTLNGWMAARLAAHTRQGQDGAHMLRLAEAWEAINRAAATADAFNLDRKPLIFEAFGTLAEAARG